MLDGNVFAAWLMLGILGLSVITSVMLTLSANLNFKRTKRIRKEVESRWCSRCSLCQRGTSNVLEAYNRPGTLLRYSGQGTWKLSSMGCISWFKMDHCPACGRKVSDDR